MVLSTFLGEDSGEFPEHAARAHIADCIADDSNAILKPAHGIAQRVPVSECWADARGRKFGAAGIVRCS